MTEYQMFVVVTEDSIAHYEFLFIWLTNIQRCNTTRKKVLDGADNQFSSD